MGETDADSMRGFCVEIRGRSKQKPQVRSQAEVHKVVDGKLQGDPEYLPCTKAHKLFRHLGWVRPLGLKWPDFNVRCTVYRQRVLELWPSRPPAAQTAPEQQPEDRTRPDPFKPGVGPPPAGQRRPTKASKPDNGAKPSRKPSSAQVARDAAIQRRLLDNGDRPPDNVTWPKFCQTIRVEGGGFIGDPKDEKYQRGFSDDTIEEVTRELMKSLAL
jgi:hypothetical protein